MRGATRAANRPRVHGRSSVHELARLVLGQRPPLFDAEADPARVRLPHASEATTENARIGQCTRLDVLAEATSDIGPPHI